MRPMLPSPSARTIAMARDYLALTKPRVLLLVVASALPVFAMAQGARPSLAWSLAVLLGIALAAGSANALNCLLERERDGRMERTRARPLPAARLTPRQALVFGLALAALATAVLGLCGGMAAAGIGVATVLFYVFVYTVWLKPRSAWNAVVGGAAGAAAPLIADAALHGRVGAAGLLLFAIVFLWQPPHVWAIALYRRSDYAAAGIPTLVSVAGEARTCWTLLLCTLALVPVTLLPAALGLLGGVYLTAAVALGAWFVAQALRLARAPGPAAARRAFHTSLLYLFVLFAAMLADRWLA